MSLVNTSQNRAVQQWITVLIDSSGQHTAQVVGLQELRATAPTRTEAIEKVRGMLGEWLASGQLTVIEVPAPNPLLQFAGHLDSNDPLEQEFVAELARRRREDFEQTLREEGQACPNSSSTPTT
jgi:hypothetical protein